MKTEKYVNREFIRIFENDNFIVEYDKLNKQYIVNVFEDGHWIDECWFDAYDEKPIFVEGINMSQPNQNYKNENCQLTSEEFIKTYCNLCGTQRCEGIYSEWFDGCEYKNLLKK